MKKITRPIATLVALTVLIPVALGAVDGSIPLLSGIQSSLNSLVEVFAPAPLRLTARLTAENTATPAFTPPRGKFSFGLHVTGSPTVHLLRAVDVGTARRATISGGTTVTFTEGDSGWVQTGMYVTGPGIPEGTTYTIGASATQGTLSQAATNGPGVPLTFWALDSTYTASTGQNVEWSSSTSWRFYIPTGGLGGGTATANFVR